MNESHRWTQRFAVEAVIWRRYVDWTILNVPFYFHPLLIFFSTLLFFFFAAAARRTVCGHFAIILPGSSRRANYLRTFQTFYNFAWTLTEAGRLFPFKETASSERSLLYRPRFLATNFCCQTDHSFFHVRQKFRFIRSLSFDAAIENTELSCASRSSVCTPVRGARTTSPPRCNNGQPF